MQAACPRCRARSGAGVTRCLLVATFVLALAATCSASRVGSASRILRTALPSRRAALVSLAVSQGVPNDAPRAAGEGPRATAADINALTTELNDAIQREDFAAAARFRDQIAACAGQTATLDGWIQLGAPEWLAERAERLGFRVPTPVQRRAFRTLTASDTVIRSQTGSGKTLSYLMPILSALSDDLLEEDMTSYLSTYLGGGADEGASTERDARARSLAGRDAVSRNDREQQRNGPLLVIVVATRELGVQVAMLAYQLCGGNRNPIIQPFAHPRRFEPGSLTNMFKYTGPRHVKIAGVWDRESLNASMPVSDFGFDSLRGCHIVVGTPECLAAVARRGHLPLHEARFTVVDEADACMRVPAGAAAAAAAAAAGGAAGDGAAAASEESSAAGGRAGAELGSRALADILRRPGEGRSSDAAAGRPATDGASDERAGSARSSNPWRKAQEQPRRVLVGASIAPSEVGAAMAAGWLSTNASLIVEEGVLDASAVLRGRADGQGGGGEAGAGGAWAGEQQRVPPGLAHRYVQVDKKEALGALVRLIRKELLDWEEYQRTAAAIGLEPAASGSGGSGEGAAGVRTRPRMIVFCESGDTAVRIASPLQSTLWSGLGGDIDAGLCGLSVLLPNAEDRLEMSKDDASVAKVQESSLRVIEMFAIESTNLLITTVGATRGLDFANVTHVFNLGVTGEPTDYLHRAGRAGRIGHRVRGVVTSIVDADGVRELRALGAKLGFEPTATELPLQSAYASVSGNVSVSQDEQVRYLEDILQLYSRGEPVDGDDDRAASD